MCIRDRHSYARPGRSLYYYINNLDDYSLFRPNLFYGATSSFGRWSYNCDNACFYSSRIDCVYNEIAGSDTEVRDVYKRQPIRVRMKREI